MGSDSIIQAHFFAGVVHQRLLWLVFKADVLYNICVHIAEFNWTAVNCNSSPLQPSLVFCDHAAMLWHSCSCLANHLLVPQCHHCLVCLFCRTAPTHWHHSSYPSCCWQWLCCVDCYVLWNVYSVTVWLVITEHLLFVSSDTECDFSLWDCHQCPCKPGYS